MKITEEQELAQHAGVKGPMDRIRQKRKGERAYTNDEIAEHETLAAEIRAKLDDYQPERMRAALAALSGVAQQPSSLREALDNSQSLLVMILHLGEEYAMLSSRDISNITKEDWAREGLTKLLTHQIAENRARLDAPPVTEGVRGIPGREDIAFEFYRFSYPNYWDWPREEVRNRFNNCRGSITWNLCIRSADAVIDALTAARDTEGK